MTQYAVVGSRGFPNKDLVISILTKLIRPEDIIVSGGAVGVDTWAADFAKSNGITLLEFLPDWEQFGRAAGMIRNAHIVSHCDEVLAFWNGESKGTKNTIDIARKQHKPVTVFVGQNVIGARADEFFDPLDK